MLVHSTQQKKKTFSQNCNKQIKTIKGIPKKIINDKKVGERIELQSSVSNSIKTTVTKDQFQEFFGPFPTINCSAT